MDASKSGDRNVDTLRSPVMSPRSSHSRAGQAIASGFQPQLQELPQFALPTKDLSMPSDVTEFRGHPCRPPASAYPAGATSSDRAHSVLSPRSAFHLAGYMKQTFLGGDQAISPSPTDREFPIARVDPWPLTLSPMASPRRLQFAKTPDGASKDSPVDALSVLHVASLKARTSDDVRRHEAIESTESMSTLSPRRRQAHARQKARIIEESKLQPVLLQELQSFLLNELRKLEGGVDGVTAADESTVPSSLRRLQVFRALFQRLIEAFSVYAPLLTLIRDEYERVITALRARCEQLPRLRSQLQTLETQCLQEISLHSLEERGRILALKKQLKNTQGRLTACAAQNAGLREQIELLQQDIARLETRSDGLQLSNHTLVNSIKRHDETLQQVHQRSVNDGQALQQVTQKYYHACDEITELKKTITYLEEKVDGVQVAADKTTIALLTKELQELHSTTQSASSAKSTCETDSNRSFAAKSHAALNSAFVRAFRAVGVSITLPALLESVMGSRATLITSWPDGDPWTSSATSDAEFDDTIRKTAQTIQVKLLQLRQLQSTVTAPRDGSATSEESTVFLTEPPDQRTNSSSLDNQVAGSLQAIQTLSPLCIPAQDYIACRGVGLEVPEHLRFDGVVRNLHFSLEAVEQIISKVWDLQDEIAKARAKSVHNASSSAFDTYANSSSSETDPRLRSRSPSLPPLRAVLLTFLHHNCAQRTEVAETSYNLVAGLERFASVSSDCRLFQLVLEREAPDDARHGRNQEISVLHEALVVIDRERQSDNQSAGASSDAGAVDDIVPHGCVSIADVIRSLRLLFPWKTDASLRQLHRALLQEVRGCHFVDYATLLRHHANSSTDMKSGKSRRNRAHTARDRFIECIRAQYVDDIVDYRRYLQQQIIRELMSSPAAEAASPVQGTAISVAPSETSDASGSALTLPDDGTYMISILALRECIQRCDPSKTVYDIATILSAVSGLSSTQILTQDDTMVDGRHVINCLPTLLVRPSGHFVRSAASEIV